MTKGRWDVPPKNVLTAWENEKMRRQRTMKLSKKEAKARTKLIQENHYNKEDQRILDEVAAKMSEAYLGLHYSYRNGTCSPYNLILTSTRICREFREMAVSAGKMAAALSGFKTAYKSQIKNDNMSENEEMQC